MGDVLSEVPRPTSAPAPSEPHPMQIVCQEIFLCRCRSLLQQKPFGFSGIEVGQLHELDPFLQHPTLQGLQHLAASVGNAACKHPGKAQLEAMPVRVSMLRQNLCRQAQSIVGAPLPKLEGTLIP